MVHPVFQDIPNADMAQVCTEIFDLEFKFATSSDTAERYGNSGFPPTPAHMTSITVAYLDTTPDGVPAVRRQYADLRTDLAGSAEIAELYEATITEAQNKIGILTILGVASPELHRGIGGVAGVQEWHANTVARAGGRLLGAHITARTVSDNRLIDTVAIPHSVFTQLPLTTRNAVSRMKPDLDKVLEGGMVPEGEKERMTEALRTYLRNDPVLAKLGDISVASFLPNAKEHATLLRSLPPTRQSGGDPPGGNRTQRRKQKRGKRY